MSIRLRLGPADIVSARFAISPLWEVGNAVRLLTRPELSGYHEPWLASVQPELDSVDLSAVMALHPPGAGLGARLHDAASAPGVADASSSSWPRWHARRCSS